MKKSKLFNLISLSIFSITVITTMSCDKIPLSPCINKEGQIVLGSKKDDIEVNVESKGISSNGSVTLTANANTVKNDNCKEIVSLPANFSFKWKADNGELSSNSGSTVSWNGKGKATVTVSVLVDGEFKKDSTITVDDGGKVVNLSGSSSNSTVNNSSNLVNNASGINSGSNKNLSNSSSGSTDTSNKDVNLGEGLVSDVNNNRKNILINIKNYLNELKPYYLPSNLFKIETIGKLNNEDLGKNIRLNQKFSLKLNSDYYQKVLSIRKKYQKYITFENIQKYLTSIDLDKSEYNIILVLLDSKNQAIGFTGSLNVNDRFYGTASLGLSYFTSTYGADILTFWQFMNYSNDDNKSGIYDNLAFESDVSPEVIGKIKSAKIIFSKISDFSKFGYTSAYGVFGFGSNLTRSLSLSEVEMDNSFVEDFLNQKISKIEDEIKKY